MHISNPNAHNICKTCGTRYATGKFDEKYCLVCLDDRQYLKSYGQQWLSYSGLLENHTVKIKQLREDIFELKVFPSFAIGQKAHLILTPKGNILWDCIPFLDEATLAFIQSQGGINAIAISHPHYYSLMQEWANAFECPVHLHQADRKWVMDKEKHVHYFSEEKLPLLPGLEVIHTGGHFPGSAVLHYQPQNHKPSLFIGDTLYLSLDKKHLSAMYSYPNVIPLAPDELFRVFKVINTLTFDSMFGAFSWQNVYEGAKDIFTQSFERYQQLYNRQL
ncbi:MBL fold metallo-hydrolase [Rapidithrix thailandica]|uniref:MBL fold metallo-hydrolase n=1 Tax=Rapidithrix thailandica TaxID=413964 RepID=A0AAW9S5J3_9BACT